MLLDELMAGTNRIRAPRWRARRPRRWPTRPGLAIITTHYDSLKALGESDARFANAGDGLRPGGAAPDVPAGDGRAGAFVRLRHRGAHGPAARAARRARELAGASSVGLEAVIARLQAREAELVKQSERLAEAEADAAATAESQREAAAALARRERELGLKAREAVDAAVAETRAALAQVVRDAQQAGSARAAEAGRAELERIAAEALAKLPAPAKPAAGAAPALAAGARVFVERLNADGVVIDPPDGRGRAKVSVGAMTIEVTADELQPAKTTAREAARARGGKPERGAPDRPAAASDDLALIPATPRRTIDVRGQNGDEALAALDAYLDRAALTGETHVVVVHGHGTGALRKRVRAHLEDSPYVARWAPGTPRQGGDGASIIELR